MARYYRGINLIAQQIDANLFYYTHNAHGDVVQRIMDNGEAAPIYEYDAFGNQKNYNDTDPNPFRYCGEYLDLCSGDYYLRNRYYEPRTGRFTTEDPIGSGLNWYTYCGGNPIAFIDPSGLSFDSFNGNVDWALEMGFSKYDAFMFAYDIDAQTQSYDPWVQEAHIAELFGSSVSNWDYNSIKFDEDLVARLLFHEDATVEGMHGIAWTLRNSMDKGYDIDFIIKNWYMKEGASWVSNEGGYFRPYEWISANPEWSASHDSAKGQSTMDSWLMAVNIAQGVISNDLGPNPFIGTVAPDPTNVVQYLGKFGASETAKNSPNIWIHIGNSYFYYDGVRAGS